jgi:hypothetical protein
VQIIENVIDVERFHNIDVQQLGYYYLYGLGGL